MRYPHVLPEFYSTAAFRYVLIEMEKQEQFRRGWDPRSTAEL